MGSVELVLAIAAALFCFSSAVSWVKGQFEDSWTEEKLRDLAAEVVAVSEGASLAGIDLIDEQGVRETLDLIAAGVTADSGDFQGQSYTVHGLTEDAKIRVSDYLRIHLGRLEVVPPEKMD